MIIIAATIPTAFSIMGIAASIVSGALLER